MKTSWVPLWIASAIWLVIALVSMSCGSSTIPWQSYLDLITGSDALDPTHRTILLQIRLPRVIVASCVGGSLAAAGVGFQGLFRNPLAEPYIIGASSGAALGVSIAIVLGLQSTLFGLSSTAVLAFFGAISVVLLVLIIGLSSRSISVTTMLLAGVVLGSMVNAIVSALMFFFDQKAVIILGWLLGSFASSHWGTATLVSLLGFLGCIGTLMHSRGLDAYSLGDEAARSLGLELLRFRIGIILSCTLLTAASVSVAGVIGFVGLVAPHLARNIVVSRHAFIIPMSILLGASLMLLADMVARTVIAPVEMPVGIITAILGSPVFLWLLLNKRARAAGG